MGRREDNSKSVGSAMPYAEQSNLVDHGSTSQASNDSTGCSCQSSSSMQQFQAANSESNNQDASSESYWNEDDFETFSADGALQHNSDKIKHCFNEQQSENGRDIENHSWSDGEPTRPEGHSLGNDIHIHFHDSHDASGTGKVPADELERAMEGVLNQRLVNLGLNKHLHMRSSSAAPRGNKAREKSRRANQTDKCGLKSDFKQVDQVWDENLRSYKIVDTADEKPDDHDEFVFVVRRKFEKDFNGQIKHAATAVDIKSALLRNILREVMKDVRSVSLVEDKPSIRPDFLFLYLEELRSLINCTLKPRAKDEKRPTVKNRIEQTRSHCKSLVQYLDSEYEKDKRTLYPMLENGIITFDLLWALFKPNTLIYTSTYDSTEHPRLLKLEDGKMWEDTHGRKWYELQGSYLEFDGKGFGHGTIVVKIDAFEGPRKITDLRGYPLQYHHNPETLRHKLIERGKQFVCLQGMNYKIYKGLAFRKQERNGQWKTVLKVNVDGRVMIDPQLFRRIDPNYEVSKMRSRVENPFGKKFGSGTDDDTEQPGAQLWIHDKSTALRSGTKPDTETFAYVVVDGDRNYNVVERVLIGKKGQPVTEERSGKQSTLVKLGAKGIFTEEELLLASPVVLGFAFGEKLWLELSVSSIHDIKWGEGAFDSLMIPEDKKRIVKALVQSHSLHRARTIDDVVQGKGKGLVSVLHGPPGTGKTMTAESVAELLKCPLYVVTAGELGTDPGALERELQRILDAAHAWGAVLLLDEADVFLEQRREGEIHRNALVSVFLRLLEYFQGIMFLTTNRVETFDAAFQSRIHVALRYGELTQKARKSVWKVFMEKVRKTEKEDTGEFTDLDYDVLSRKIMNGRNIKNTVRTAQALAVNEGKKLTMEHIDQVMRVAECFERDLKGGPGYDEAMRSYT